MATSMRKCFIQHGAKETSLLAAEPAMNPIVFARFPASSKLQTSRPKTLLFYGHYDVVDAKYDPLEETGRWQTEPFEAASMNGYLYGRGMTDNKGPVTAAMFAVFELSKAEALHCNVVFLIEGEEESGSLGFAKTIHAHHDIIRPVNYILLANSYWLDDEIPCLTYGMRGVIHATVTITSSLPDRHSGVEGKASVHEPLKDLTVLLSRLIGPNATDIRIPNFYDSVPTELTPHEHARYQAISSALLPLQPGHSAETHDQASHTASLIQRWTRPNLTIHSIKVPESKNRAVTIPSVAEAALSIRTVPGQRADKIATALEKFLAQAFEQSKSDNRLEVRVQSKADAWLGDPANVLFQALERAVRKAWNREERRGGVGGRTLNVGGVSSDSAGQQSKHHRHTHQRKTSHVKENTDKSNQVLPFNQQQTQQQQQQQILYIREGGSIPAISILEKEFKAPAAMFPCGQASDNAHLDNERMRIENLYVAKEVFGEVLGEL
ncbi:MAG: hypothetical protein Q9227_002297 [Pyrenula ochraceoflavens]